MWIKIITKKKYDEMVKEWGAFAGIMRAFAERT